MAQGEGTGRIEAPLATTAADGTQYRLRHANMTITGASTHTLATDDFDDRLTVISEDLPVGGWAILLEDGWELHRIQPDHTSVPVEGTLLSFNPQYFTIADGTATSVRWRFRVPGDVVELGSGTLEVGFDVEECGTPEVVGDGIDEDCDGAELCFVDADSDGYRTTATIASTDLDCTDAGEAMATAPLGDCDDSNADARPGASEFVGDGVDEDCDGAELCFADFDADGYRTASSIPSSDGDCSDPGEAVFSAAVDCDDRDDRVHPGQTAFFETPTASGGFDYDCDGVETRSSARVLSCDSLCRGFGWLGTAPACGVEGAEGNCVRDLVCTIESDARVQSCR